MKNKIIMRTHHKLRKTFLLLSILGVLSLHSCLPPYSARIVMQIDTASRSVNTLYASILDVPATEPDGREYNQYVSQYEGISMQLDSLLKESEMISCNRKSVKICKNTIQLWNNYKEEHQTKNFLGDNLIKYNQSSMLHALDVMKDAENAKK